MSSFDPNKFKLPSNPIREDKTCIPERKVKRKGQKGFLSGPVQLDWLIVAAQLPGKAFHVGIVIWYRSGLLKTKTIPLTSNTLSRFGIDRHAKRRALEALEGASLITVERSHGKNPIVTILDLKVRNKPDA